MKVALSILFLLLFVQETIWAQKVELDWVEIIDKKVIVHYNLHDDNTSRQYLVNLYTSQDGFSKELTKVSGDVGADVTAGSDKRIIWDIVKELGDYAGNLTFEVRARIYTPFVKLINFGEGRVFKRGKNYPIIWSTGNISGHVNIELYRGDERIAGENNLPNVGKLDWHVPSTSKRANNYRLRFTNVKDRGDITYSPPFTIKPKVHTALKAMGIVVMGGAGILFGGNSGSGGTATDRNGLVKPPSIP
jgi:hypothetical protein